MDTFSPSATKVDFDKSAIILLTSKDKPSVSDFGSSSVTLEKIFVNSLTLAFTFIPPIDI